MARLAYGAWSAAEAGQPLRPYPGRSGQTTVNSRASNGATVRHIRCVSGNPCSSSTGGPEPPQRAKTLVRLVWIVTVSNASNVIPAEAIRPNSFDIQPTTWLNYSHDGGKPNRGEHNRDRPKRDKPGADRAQDPPAAGAGPSACPGRGGLPAHRRVRVGGAAAARRGRRGRHRPLH